MRVKRPPEIKHQALAATFEFDAATTDLPRSAMDARPKHARTIHGREQAASLPATEPCSLVAYARRLQPRRVHAVFVEPGVQDIIGPSEFGRGLRHGSSIKNARPQVEHEADDTSPDPREQSRCPLAYSALKPAAISVSPIGRPRIVRQNSRPAVTSTRQAGTPTNRWYRSLIVCGSAVRSDRRRARRCHCS